MDAPSRSDKLKLCQCPKCLRNSDNGQLLKPTTYWRHNKRQREDEKLARQEVLFQQFGLEAPSASLPSTVSSNRTGRRKKRAKVRPISYTGAPNARMFPTCRQSTPSSHRPHLRTLRMLRTILYTINSMICMNQLTKYMKIRFSQSCHAPQPLPLRIRRTLLIWFAYLFLVKLRPREGYCGTSDVRVSSRNWK
jgi:hypothetical protein